MRTSVVIRSPACDALSHDHAPNRIASVPVTHACGIPTHAINPWMKTNASADRIHEAMDEAITIG
jgi:hypothetical protein